MIVFQELTAIGDFLLMEICYVGPAFLLSILFSVLIRELKLDRLIHGAFTARVGLSILLATAIGAFSPFCSCTVVPVINGLLLSGIPLAPVMSFWIASPTMDPEIFTLSVATIGWPLAVARLAATLILSLGAGYLTLALTRSGLLGSSLLRQQEVPEAPCGCPTENLIPASEIALQSNPAGGCGCASSDVSSPLQHRQMGWLTGIMADLRALDWKTVGRNMAKESWNLGRWLVLAFLLAAVIVRYVPQTAILEILGNDIPFAVPLAAFIGIPLYMGNITALPILSGLLEQGMQPGAAIAFLIAGPITTVSAMTTVGGIARWRVFALYVGLGVIGAIVLGLITNMLFLI